MRIVVSLIVGLLVGYVCTHAWHWLALRDRRRDAVRRALAGDPCAICRRRPHPDHLNPIALRYGRIVCTDCMPARPYRKVAV